MVTVKDVIGYEGIYKADIYGNIYSIKTGKKRKLVNEHHGYKRVMLYKNGKGKAFFVHRIIAELFVQNPNQYKEINHINEDKSDNRAENLEWCTRYYNIHYGNRIQSMSKRTIQKLKGGNIIAIFDSQAEASRKTGISQGSISNACSGRCKTAGGYIWELV